MPALDKVHMNRLREKLEARRSELVAEIREKLTESRAQTGTGEISQWSETGDQALATLIASTDMAMAQRDIVELRELESAFGRMADGSYGTCIDCGQEIEPERLEVYPTAPRCTVCQENYERTRGKGAGSSL